MKTFLLICLTITACTSNKIVYDSEDWFSAEEQLISKLVYIEMKGSGELRAVIHGLSIDSVYFKDMSSKKIRSEPIDTVEAIVFQNRRLGFYRGAVVGFLMGAAIGATIGFVEGDDCTDRDLALFCLTRTGSSVLNGLIFGVAGTFTGMFLGNTLGVDERYVFGTREKEWKRAPATSVLLNYRGRTLVWHDEKAYWFMESDVAETVIDGKPVVWLDEPIYDFLNR